MRNYIILNGNNSNEITGLLIQSLPPISKPLMRTAIEEIDGRDGDIVTTLGYSAYDKELSIGLYGSYDVDEVIKFFSDNSKGQVTFSNEPDKYYNYEIINQIDFERLIRFKTATVTLHCQPFKYPTEETPVEIAYQYINNEAEEMDLDNTADAPMQVNLKGNTSQASEPTPTSPQDIHVVSGDNTIEICGKNLFDKSTMTLNSAIDAGNGNMTSNANFVSIYANCEPNTKYTIQKIVSNRFVIGFATDYDLTLPKQLNNQVAPGTSLTSYTFTTPNNAKRVFITISKTSDDTTPIQNILDSIMIEKGETASTYEPYTGQSQLISLGTLELCKISTYQDYIYKSNNIWYLHKEIGKKVITGSDSTLSRGGTNSQGYRWRVTLDNPLPATSASTTTPLFCNRLTAVTPGNTYNGVQGITIDTANDYSFFYITDIKNNSLDNTKTWLNSNNIILYYILKEATNTEITDTTLLEQLENIANARSYDTSTHITQNANDKPFILNATAVQKGTDTATVDNDGNIYSKPTLDIEGNGIVAIYLNGNQMFSIDMSSSSECVIDVTNLEAYDPETNELLNRQVTGDYSNFTLPVGENEVKVSGNVTKATITDYTRWL